MPFLKRDEILAVSASKVVPVEVPEWGGTVGVKVMTGLQRDRWEAAVSKDPGNNSRARLAAYCLCDEDGKSLYTEADIIALGNTSGAALQRVMEVAMEANKVSKAALEDEVKNSETAPSGSTP